MFTFSKNVVKVFCRYFEHLLNSQGRKFGGVWRGGTPPQTYVSVGLKMSAVGLKI